MELSSKHQLVSVMLVKEELELISVVYLTLSGGLIIRFIVYLNQLIFYLITNYNVGILLVVLYQTLKVPVLHNTTVKLL